MKKLTWHWTILGSLVAASTVACGGASSEGEESEGPLVSAKGAALHKAEGCDDLLAQIQADAVAKLDDVIATYQDNRYQYYGYPTRGGGLDAEEPAVSGTTTGSRGDVGDTTGGTSTGSSTGGDGDSNDWAEDEGQSAGEGDKSGGNPDSYSRTNTQVEDVDEADIVKIGDDGKRIYVVHGSLFKIMDAWPVDEVSESGATQVAGEPFELFVHDGKATVFSRVFPSGLPGEQDRKNACWYGGGDYTQISVFDVSGAAPVLEREMLFEGDYVSSRRHDDTVRAIVRGGFNGHDVFHPDVEIYDSFGREKSEERIAEDLQDWRDDVVLDIKNTTLEDWLPERFERVDDSWVEMDLQCDGYFIPQPGLVEAGVTQVIALAPKSQEAPQVTAVLGGSDTVYANASSLYVAHRDYRWNRWAVGDGPRTVLHKFAIEADASPYKASGFIPGTPLNQFALDERDQILRIATTEDDWSGDVKNKVFTLGEEGQDLKVIDQSDNLGEEGETIYAVRFVEDRGYVVTFRQTDPLYALDLSDPADIRVLGELHVPGFSEYMHPLGDHHLLTIGQDADDDGRTDGVALQIFDVSDATSPKQAAKYTFGGFSWSEAGYNHKAFTFVKDYFDGGDDLLLFPLVTYEPDYKSGLEVFRISEGEGFSHLGSIDHAGLINRGCESFTQYQQPCFYYYGEEMRRGLQIDQYVYALSQGGLTVHDVDALDAGAVSTVAFDRPVYEGQSACYEYWYEGDYGYAMPDEEEWGSTTGTIEDPEPAVGGSSSSTTGVDTSGTGTSMGGAFGN